MMKKLFCGLFVAAFVVFFLGTGYAAPDGTVVFVPESNTPLHSIGGTVLGSDGTLYISSLEGDVTAFNPDGTTKWNFETGDSFASPPAIMGDGNIVVTSLSGKAYDFNTDGTLNHSWNFGAGGTSVYTSPTWGPDGTVYVGSYDSKLYAFDPNAPGTPKWTYSTTGGITSSMVIGPDGRAYMGSTDGKLYAFDLNNIDPNAPAAKWTYSTGGEVNSTPAIGSDGTIYVGSDDRKVHAVNPDGSGKWTYTTGGAITTSVVIAPDGKIHVGSRDGKVYVLKPEDGSLDWSYDTAFPIGASPAIGSDATTYVGTDAGTVYAFNADGTVKWWCNPSLGTRSQGGPDGAVKTSRAANGAAIQGPINIGIDGTIYVGASNGKFYGISSSSRGLANSVWPKFKHDVRNSGWALYPFPDVALTHWAHGYTTAIYNAGYTTGYGGTNNFMPDLNVTREQMAAFVIRAKEGEPAANYCSTGVPFTDITDSVWSCKYIKRLYELNITSGYGGTTQYMPALNVTRAQMAAFIVRALEGEPAADYCATSIPFTDVTAADWFCKYVKRLYELGITTGYGGTNQYAPNVDVTRAQMAAFLARAFIGLP